MIGQGHALSNDGKTFIPIALFRSTWLHIYIYIYRTSVRVPIKLANRWIPRQSCAMLHDFASFVQILLVLDLVSWIRKKMPALIMLRYSWPSILTNGMSVKISGNRLATSVYSGLLPKLQTFLGSVSLDAVLCYFKLIFTIYFHLRIKNQCEIGLLLPFLYLPQTTIFFFFIKSNELYVGISA
jgi:hypothetical protein